MSYTTKKHLTGENVMVVQMFNTPKINICPVDTCIRISFGITKIWGIIVTICYEKAIHKLKNNNLPISFFKAKS